MGAQPEAEAGGRVTDRTAAGATGATSTAGATGATSTAGATGATSTAGAAGATGATRATGVGAAGVTGAAGAKKRRVPPHAYFLVSAIFHYLGPALAVLLFAQIAPLGVAWLRIVSAAVVFTLWRRPARLWRLWRDAAARIRWLLIAFGMVLAAMNACFYLAIARIPLATVGAMEFLGPVALAALGVRTRRNAAALALAVAGVALLSEVKVTGQPVGLAFSFANCALFTLYIVLGHRIAAAGGSAGIDRLAVAMLIAAVAISPAGIAAASAALRRPLLLGAGCGVGVCSSVIPYVTDQLAMARLPRAAFALLMSLLPASATVIGVIILHQLPGPAEVAGIALVAGGVALRAESPRATTPG
jgi:inner membrane transporter RhtA